MLFNSHAFIWGFLPVVLAGFFWLARIRPSIAAAWLAAASLFFYGWWSPWYVPLLVASAAFNFAAGMLIARLRGRPAASATLIVAVTANLALLGFFKYANFLIDSANTLRGGSSPLLDIVLPLGISFYTFTQIAYLVDVRRGLARDYDFVHYLLFVTYFPHLIAGPILHHKEVMPQFDAPETYRPRSALIAMGLTLFVIGLAKKVLIADHFAIYADPVFDAARDGLRPQLIAAWTGALAYTLQLYFDFSGYSDMAVGISLMFGVRLPLNFASPYKAASIAEFWGRWHMTLSRFLRDYLYIPLGGNRHGALRRHLNLMVTMLLGGLWHGASWTFVAWGGLHGLFLVAYLGWRRAREAMGWGGKAPGRAGTIAAVGLTFVCVVVAWVLFRAATFESAASMLSGMVGLNGASLPQSLEGGALAQFLPRAASFHGAFEGVPALQTSSVVPAAGWIAAALAIVWLLPNSQQLLGLDEAVGPAGMQSRPAWWRPTPAMALAAGLVFAVVLLNLSRVSTFLYYQF